jgi:hypothetical protein
MQLGLLADDKQVEGAKYGVAQNAGGMASICAVNVLRRASK